VDCRLARTVGIDPAPPSPERDGRGCQQGRALGDARRTQCIRRPRAPGTRRASLGSLGSLGSAESARRAVNSVLGSPIFFSQLTKLPPSSFSSSLLPRSLARTGSVRSARSDRLGSLARSDRQPFPVLLSGAHSGVQHLLGLIRKICREDKGSPFKFLPS